MQQRLLPKVRIMKTTVEQKQTAEQSKYKKDFEKRMKHQHDINVRQGVIIDSTSQGAFGSDHVDKLTGRWYRKLVGKSIGPLKALEVRSNTVWSMEIKVHNFLSTDCLILSFKKP